MFLVDGGRGGLEERRALGDLVWGLRVSLSKTGG